MEHIINFNKKGLVFSFLLSFVLFFVFPTFFGDTPVAYADTTPSCPSGQTLETPASNPSIFSSTKLQNVAYACEVQIPNGDGTGSNLDQFYDASGNPAGQTTSSIGGTVTLDKNNVPVDKSCSFIWGTWTFTDCIWIPAMQGIATVFLFIGASILRTVGFVFDYLIWYFVVNFGKTLSDSGLATAITSGWTLFRNLANIVIIGMFTFIAINIILGLKEYGQKKLIANVLIVAIFINFSLLFTKMVVDFSNDAAYQFYSQIAAQQGLGSDTTAGGVLDITSGFLDKMGMKSIFDSGKAVSNFTQIQQVSTNVTSGQTASSASAYSIGLQTLMFGIVGGFLLIALALVLGYGCFLLAERFFIILFLMFTSSIALTTYLHPKLSGGKYGFSTWLSALINVSIFGPLLMIFLWITMLILNAGSAAGGIGSGGTSMGTLISDPSQIVTTSGWATIILYLVGIGFLFISFKISNSVASAGGALTVNALPSSLKGATSTVGSFAYRNTVSRLASGFANSRTKEAERNRNESGRLKLEADIHSNKGEHAEAKQKQDESNRLARLATRQSNGYVTQRAKTAGKSFDDAVAKRKASTKDNIDKITPSRDDISKVRKSAEERVRTDRETRTVELKDNLKKARESAEQSSIPLKAQVLQKTTERAEIEKSIAAKSTERETIIKELNTARESNPDYAHKQTEVDDLQKDSKNKQESHEQNIKGMQQKLAVETDPTKRKDIQNDISKTEENRRSEMRHEAERIDKARLEAAQMEESDPKMKDIRTKLTAVDSEIKTRRAQVTEADKIIQSTNSQIAQNTMLYTTKEQSALDEYEAETKVKAKEAGNRAEAEVKEGAANVAGEIARRSGTISERVVGSVTGDNNALADNARRDTLKSKKMGGKTAADIMKDYVKERDEEDKKTT